MNISTNLNNPSIKENYIQPPNFPHLVAFHNQIKRTFSPLPSDGKLFEIIKRVGLVVIAPLAYLAHALSDSISLLYRSPKTYTQSKIQAPSEKQGKYSQIPIFQPGVPRINVTSSNSNSKVKQLSTRETRDPNPVDTEQFTSSSKTSEKIITSELKSNCIRKDEAPEKNSYQNLNSPFEIVELSHIVLNFLEPKDAKAIRAFPLKRFDRQGFP